MKKKSRKWVWIIVVIAICVCVGVLSNKPKTENVPDTTQTGPDATASFTESKTESEITSSTDSVDAETSESTTSSESTAEETPAPANGIRPEFKEAMDSYEAFYNEYCEFMSDYNKNPNDLKLLAGYAEMLSKSADMNKKFEAWGEGDMSEEELKYYLDVNTRVQKKMIDIL